MVCFEPISAFLPFNEDSEGKKKLIFSPNIVNKMVAKSNIAKCTSYSDVSFQNIMSGYNDDRIILSPDFYFSGNIEGCIIKVPCGKCLGCRNDSARRWTVRNYHEAFTTGFQNCCFITLTFNNKMLYSRDNPWSLNKSAFSGFIKRLRERIRDKYNITNVRFFACGEYGSLKNRPHYHMLVYGFNFPDKIIMRGSGFPKKLQPNYIGDRLICNYYSPFLNSCWSPAGSDESFGFATISDLTFEDCAYTSRYILKKLGNFNKSAGRESEFINASRMPGLGYDFFKKYYKNILALGYIDCGNGRKSDIPRYYINKLEEINPEYYERLKFDRRNNFLYNLFDEEKNPTEQRLKVKKELLNQKLLKYVRSYEFDPDLHNI